MSWPEPVERVAAFLLAAGAEARIEELDEPVPTVAAAAETIGCDPGRIVKSYAYDCDGRDVVVLVPGDRRADPVKVARALGASSARTTGTEEIAAFPPAEVERVLIEHTLLALDSVWIGAGTDHHVARLAPGELMRLAKAESLDAVAEG
ncbi:MAG: YbaK/EbsC family protein [Gaiellaceae bacterium]